MRLSKTFPMPDEDPVVPERLAERITNLFPHTTKIDVKRPTRGGWQVVTTIYLEGGEEASEVYTIIKAAADYFANESGQYGKYRAQVWRLPPGKTDHERHTVTFMVHDESEGEEAAPEVPETRETNSGWLELFEAQQRFLEFSAEYSNRAIDRVLEQSKQDAERLNPMADVLHDMVGIYRDGLRMKADSVQELGDLRVRQQVAEAQARDSGKFWEMMAPAMQVAAMQMGQRFLGGGQPKPRALPPGTVPAPTMRRQDAPAQVVTVTAPSVPSTVVRSAPSSPPADPLRSSSPADPAAASSPAPAPATLHELAGALLDSMGAECLVQLGSMLDSQQITFLRAIARAEDDDTSAEAIAMLMQSLRVNPSAVLALQQALSPEQIGALQQIAMLAQRHLEERAAGRTEGAPPSSGDAPSAGKDAAGS